MVQRALAAFGVVDSHDEGAALFGGVLDLIGLVGVAGEIFIDEEAGGG